METVLLEHFPAGLDFFMSAPYFNDEEFFTDHSSRDPLEGDKLLEANDFLEVPFHGYCHAGPCQGGLPKGAFCCPPGEFLPPLSPSSLAYECCGQVVAGKALSTVWRQRVCSELQQLHQAANVRERQCMRSIICCPGPGPVP